MCVRVDMHTYTNQDKEKNLHQYSDKTETAYIVKLNWDVRMFTHKPNLHIKQIMRFELEYSHMCKNLHWRR